MDFCLFVVNHLCNEMVFHFIHVLHFRLISVRLAAVMLGAGSTRVAKGFSQASDNGTRLKCDVNLHKHDCVALVCTVNV